MLAFLGPKCLERIKYALNCHIHILNPDILQVSQAYITVILTYIVLWKWSMFLLGNEFIPGDSYRTHHSSAGVHLFSRLLLIYEALMGF